MNLFKKKYIRSEWYQALLDAEELHKQEGFSLVVLPYELRGCTEYEDGVYDYIEHMKNISRRA